MSAPPAKRARPPALDAVVSTVAAPGLSKPYGKPNGLFVLADGTLLACAGHSIRVLAPSGLLSFVAGSNTSSGNQDGPGATRASASLTRHHGGPNGERGFADGQGAAATWWWWTVTTTPRASCPRPQRAERV